MSTREERESDKHYSNDKLNAKVEQLELANARLNNEIKELKKQRVRDKAKADELKNRWEYFVAGAVKSIPLLRMAYPTLTLEEDRNVPILPFQIAESIPAKNYNNSSANRLIWGDNLYVLNALLNEYTGKIDFIYIDPPFQIGRDFYIDIDINGNKETTNLSDICSIFQLNAYNDTWKDGYISYIKMLYQVINLSSSLLSDRGYNLHTFRFKSITLYTVDMRENLR